MGAGFDLALAAGQADLTSLSSCHGSDRDLLSLSLREWGSDLVATPTLWLRKRSSNLQQCPPLVLSNRRSDLQSRLPPQMEDCESNHRLRLGDRAIRAQRPVETRRRNAGDYDVRVYHIGGTWDCHCRTATGSSPKSGLVFLLKDLTCEGRSEVPCKGSEPNTSLHDTHSSHVPPNSSLLTIISVDWSQTAQVLSDVRNSVGREVNRREFYQLLTNALTLNKQSRLHW